MSPSGCSRRSGPCTTRLSTLGRNIDLPPTGVAAGGGTHVPTGGTGPRGRLRRPGHPRARAVGVRARRGQHEEAARCRDGQRHPGARACAAADRQPQRRHPCIRHAGVRGVGRTTSRAVWTAAGYKITVQEFMFPFFQRPRGSDSSRRSRRRRQDYRDRDVPVLGQRRRDRQDSCRPPTTRARRARRRARRARAARPGTSRRPRRPSRRSRSSSAARASSRRRPQNAEGRRL